MKTISLLILAIFLFVNARSQELHEKNVTGKLFRVENFQSKYAKPRIVDIWLPDNYDQNSKKKYAVMYMNDGQNLFSTETSFGGNEWGVDETLTRLMQHDSIRNCIVVGIWNTDLRFREYDPQKPFETLPDDVKKQLSDEYQGEAISDNYLKFIVEELKPYIDQHYRTFTDRKNTFIGGSSMGGLISLYAILEYPNVFGGAACISTHWPVSLKEDNPVVAQAMIHYAAQKINSKLHIKLYFDYGTKTLDSLYEPYQKMMDGIMMQAGFTSKNWMTKKFPGDAHNEYFWRRRFAIPAVFLLAK